MPDGVDLILGAERLLEVRQRRAQNQQGVPDLFLACLVPAWRREIAGAILAYLDCVLQRMDLVDIPGVGRIDESANGNDHIARADLLLCKGMGAGAVGHCRYIVILIDEPSRT